MIGRHPRVRRGDIVALLLAGFALSACEAPPTGPTAPDVQWMDVEDAAAPQPSLGSAPAVAEALAGVLPDLSTLSDGRLVEVPESAPVAGSEAGSRVSRSVGPPDGFPLVFVRSGGGAANAGAAGAPVVDNVEDAIARVADGGTIRIGPGRYLVENVRVDRAVTIESAGGEVVLEFPAPSRPLGFMFLVDQVQSGTVIFRNLTFEVGVRWAIVAQAPAWDRLVVENSSFVLGAGTIAGVGLGPTADSPQVTIRNSSFTGGQTGVLAIGFDGFQLEATVTASTFTGQFIGVFNGGADVDLIGNSLEGQSAANIFYASANDRLPRGRVEGNTIDGCSFACVLLQNTLDVTVAANQLRTEKADHTFFGILAGGPGTTGLAILDNELDGLGVPSDPTDFTTYTWEGSAIQIDVTATPVEVSRNLIRNAHQGIFALGGSITGLDNVLTLNHQPLKVANDGHLDIHSSDLTDYQISVNFGFPPAGTADLTCNWWGTADGPVNPDPGFDLSVYTPWATQPVAGTSTTTCSGGL